MSNHIIVAEYVVMKLNNIVSDRTRKIVNTSAMTKGERFNNSIMISMGQWLLIVRIRNGAIGHGFESFGNCLTSKSIGTMNTGY